MGPLQGFENQFLRGALTTLQVALSSLTFGILVGLSGAMAKASHVTAIRVLAHIYTTVIRGVPELLLILILYFGGTVALSAIFGRYIEINAFAAGVFALTIVFGAYATEIFRASIGAVSSGQIEAARAIGFSRYHVWRLVIIPQMMRFALPGLGNLWLTLLKDTALISVIGLDDLMRKAGIAAGAMHDPLKFYSYAAITYLLFTSISIFVLTRLEQRAERGLQRGTA